MPAKARRSRKQKQGTLPGLIARLASSPVVRTALVLGLTLIFAVGLGLLVHRWVALPLSVFRWMAAALLGVLAGLASHFLLAEGNPTLRLWVALLALLAGLAALALMAETSESAPSGDAAQSWLWLAQLGLGAALAWLTLHVFPAALPQKTPARKRGAATRSASSVRRKPAKKKDSEPLHEAKPKNRPASTRPARKSEPKDPERGAPGAAPASSARSTISSPRSGSTSRRPSHPGASIVRESQRPSAGRVRTHPEAARFGTARPRPIIHSQAPSARSEGTPTPRVLWTRPASDRPAAQNVQPRRRTQAGTRPAVTETVVQRPAMLERLRAVGESLPTWQALKAHFRSAPRHSSADLRETEAVRSSSPVRLLGQEEHRCPFCLELVEDGDPRGMVECSICHTRHHADCWAVTGACQVPHYHG